MRFLRLNGITTANRHQITSSIREAILKTNGWIVDFHLFSNVSLCINFEIPLHNLARFQSLLEEVDLKLSAESIAMLESYDSEVRAEALKDKDVAGTLQISFIHDEPELRREVPAIPG